MTNQKMKTTNECYGNFYGPILQSKDNKLSEINDDLLRKIHKLNSLRRPFSNIAFYPPMYSGSVSKAVKGVDIDFDHRMKRVPKCALKNRENLFNINKGYSIGSMSVVDRTLQAKYKGYYAKKDCKIVSEIKRIRLQEGIPYNERDIYLWHTLPGSLVHAKKQYESK